MTKPMAPLQFALKEVRKCIDAGKLKEAANRLNMIAEQHPTEPRTFLMGIALAEAADNPKAALDAAQRAIKLAPDWAPAWMELAAVLSRQGQHQQALEHANQAVRLAPDQLTVLERATAIANHAGDVIAAGNFLRQASLLAPDDASIRRGIAANLMEQRDHNQARVLFQDLLGANPEDWVSLAGLAFCALKLHDNAAAIDAYNTLLSRQPDNTEFAYYLAVAKGETPTMQPPDMAKRLFDGYASRFDQHLVGTLQYRIPRHMAEVIRQSRGDQAIDVLDLGCGTGLLGVYLGATGGALIGVDISPEMLKEARKHNLYTELITGNLTETLQATPDGQYDVIAACDVFVYVGDLAQIIVQTFRALRSGGQLIFSCERAQEEEADLVLRPSNRYAHKESAVRRQCTLAGFGEVAVESVHLRNEGSVPMEGFYVTARKSA